MTITRLEPVAQREVPDPPSVEQRQEQQVALQVIMLALKALSQRFVVALASLFTLATVASAFWLWYGALATLTVNQIVGLTIYSGFVLAVNMWGVRK